MAREEPWRELGRVAPVLFDELRQLDNRQREEVAKAFNARLSEGASGADLMRLALAALTNEKAINDA